MKTTKFRLFATMFTLVAVIFATTIPANAQSRSRQQKNEKTTPEHKRNFERTVQQKSTFKNQDRVSKERVNANLKRTRSSNKNSSAQRSGVTPSRNSVHDNLQSHTKKRESLKGYTTSREQSRSATPTHNRTQTKSSIPQNNGLRTNSRSAKSTNSISSKTDNRQYASAHSFGSSNHETIRPTTGVNVSKTREFYRVDKTDKRYRPNNNYKGSKHYWSGNNRPSKMNYNHNNSKYYKHYNYNKYNHWDHGWERYRWNHNSWLDYYQGYHPNSYVYNKYYYRHSRYGHVVRRFDFPPQVFVHNHHNYYCYNGHFFKYRSGIGYVLVDVPFGLSFEYLPHNYERVYINGYMYFRIGNLFFEWANYGFRLVHYPERYYAYSDNYYNRGYSFNDDYY